MGLAMQTAVRDRCTCEGVCMPRSCRSHATGSTACRAARSLHSSVGAACKRAFQPTYMHAWREGCTSTTPPVGARALLARLVAYWWCPACMRAPLMRACAAQGKMGDRVITGKQALTSEKPKDKDDKDKAKKKKRSQADAEGEFGLPAKSRKRAAGGMSVLDLEQVGLAAWPAWALLRRRHDVRHSSKMHVKWRAAQEHACQGGGLIICVRLVRERADMCVDSSPGLLHESRRGCRTHAKGRARVPDFMDTTALGWAAKPSVKNATACEPSVAVDGSKAAPRYMHADHL